MEVEGEGTAMYAAVKEDVNPHVNLQGNGVSHPTTLKKINFKPFLLSPLLKTSEAARTQCSPPVNAGMLVLRFHPTFFPSTIPTLPCCHRPVTSMTLMAIILQVLALLAFTLALIDLVLLVRIILYFLLFHQQLLVLFPQ
jgi:hypothetical protein